MSAPPQKRLAQLINEEFQKAAEMVEYQKELYMSELNAYKSSVKDDVDSGNNNNNNSNNNNNVAPTIHNMKSKLSNIPNKIAALVAMSSDMQDIMPLLGSHLEMFDKTPSPSSSSSSGSDDQTSFRKIRLITFVLSWLKALHSRHLTKFIVTYEHRQMFQNLVQWDLSFATCKQIVEKCIKHAEFMYGAERTKQDGYVYNILSSVGKGMKGFGVAVSGMALGYSAYSTMLQPDIPNLTGIGISTAAAGIYGFPTAVQSGLSSMKNDEDRGRYHYFNPPAKGSVMDKYLVSRETFLRKPAPGSAAEIRERKAAYDDAE